MINIKKVFSIFHLVRLDFYRFSGCLFMISLLIPGCEHMVGRNDYKPEENRFRRVVLAEHLYNPMELEVADDGSVYFIQTNGDLFKTDPQNRLTKIIGNIRNSDNSEFGLIGMALDPNFTRDHWIYLQYFLPDIPNKIAQVSRFALSNDSLDLSSEKRYVQIPYENTCCHSAGSMSFDSNGWPMDQIIPVHSTSEFFWFAG